MPDRPPDPAAAELRRLLDIMAALRDRERGCPWDVEQDFASIAPYTIEEAYEVADAILRRDFAALPDELGDLLFQVVYHARMAEEAGPVRLRRGGAARSPTRWCAGIRTCSARRRRAAPGRRCAAWDEQKGAERAERAEAGHAGRHSGGAAGADARREADPRGRRGSASTGRTPRRCWTSWTRKWPSCAPSCEAADPGAAGRRTGRRAVRGGQSRAQARPRRGALPAGGEPEVRPPFRRRRGSAGGRGRAAGEASLEEMEAIWQQVKR